MEKHSAWTLFVVYSLAVSVVEGAERGREAGREPGGGSYTQVSQRVVQPLDSSLLVVVHSGRLFA